MRARHLSLTNFRGFESLELDFDERLTVLVGVNGSGKTTVLDAVALMLRFVVEGQESLVPLASGALRNGQASGRVVLTTDRHTPAIPLEAYFTLSGAGFSGFRASLLARPDGAVPLMVFFPVARSASDRTPGSTTPSAWAPTKSWDAGFDSAANFQCLFEWFRELEDFENEARVQDGAGTDWRLDAVRAAVERAMPGFTNVRVRRPRGTSDEHYVFRRPTLAADKAGDVLAFNQLSEGERSLLAMVADIARRLAIANPSGNPLEGDGIVMIDEVELHLHPSWQAAVLDRLQAVFPNLQFIVATHSPIVLSHVKAEQIRLIEDFKVYSPPFPVEGRDAGSILSDIFGVNPLPAETRAAVRRISELVDEDRYVEAREELEALSSKLGDLDVEVTRLRTMLDLLAS